MISRQIESLAFEIPDTGSPGTSPMVPSARMKSSLQTGSKRLNNVVKINTYTTVSRCPGVIGKREGGKER